MDSRPATMRSVVLLPHPDGPTRTTNSPAATVRSTPCTATTPPSYSLRTPSSLTLAARLCGAVMRQAPDGSACVRRCYLVSHERLASFSRAVPLGRVHLGLSDRG